MSEENWTRLTTKDQFLKHVADAYFGDEGGQSVATSDGKVEGKFGGEDLKGTWYWEDDFFCRTSTLGDLDLGFDRIVIDVAKGKMRLTLQEGQGPSVVYDKKS